MRRLFQHGRDGLDGLAQSHVVGETGPRLPMRQPRKPSKPLELVVAQFRLQRRRRLGLAPPGFAQALDEGLPFLVGLDLTGVLGEVLRRHAGEDRHPPPLAVILRYAAQPLQLLAKLLGERQKAAVGEGHEPPLRLVEPRQQVAHVEDELLIDVTAPSIWNQSRARAILRERLAAETSARTLTRLPSGHSTATGG